MKKLILIPLLFLSIAQAEDNNGEVFIYHIHVGVGPYSSGNYYFYEKNNKIICTKYTECNKLDNCSTKYSRGEKIESYTDLPDNWKENSLSILIKPNSRKKHICLTREDLL